MFDLKGDIMTTKKKDELVIENIRKLRETLSIDLMTFGKLPDRSFYLRKENRDILWNKGYRWFISLGMRITNSASELLEFHEDEGMLWYFESHCYGQAERLEAAAQQIAIYIDSQGYGAFVVPGRKKAYKNGPFGIISHSTLAHISNMGSVGDSGLIISKELGPRFRMSTILTTMQLPSAKTKLEDNCIHCGKCRDICPVGAIKGISFDMSNPSLPMIDSEICKKYKDERRIRFGSGFCNRCQQICPVGSSFKEILSLVKNEVTSF